VRVTCGRWIILCGVGLSACAGDSKTMDGLLPTGDTGTPVTTTEGLAIAGSYTDAFGTEHVIDDASWTQTFPGSTPTTWTIASYDNDGMVVIAQNSPDDPYNPDLWSRFDWVGDLSYCQTTFDAATEADALATPRADDTDLASGCGGFGWTDLTP
jgi:hypothetical protein